MNHPYLKQFFFMHWEHGESGKLFTTYSGIQRSWCRPINYWGMDSVFSMIKFFANLPIMEASFPGTRIFLIGHGPNPCITSPAGLASMIPMRRMDAYIMSQEAIVGGWSTNLTLLGKWIPSDRCWRQIRFVILKEKSRLSWRKVMQVSIILFWCMDHLKTDLLFKEEQLWSTSSAMEWYPIWISLA